jgi:CDP-L-myo-inositol myo-inositolphosphotransferase
MANKALIIAAGRGSRLKNGDDLPKPLVEVAGVGLLKRTILSARRAGIHQFVVVTGYRGLEIREAIDTDSQIDVEIEWVHNREWARGNGLSVMAARPYLNEPFILMMSDHLFDPDILSQLRTFPIAQDEVALCVDSRLEDVLDMDDATKVVCASDRIEEIGKELKSYNAVDTGLFLCTPSLFTALEASVAQGEESLSGGIRILAARGAMRAMDCGDRFWQDVDTPMALAHAEKELYRRLGKQTDGFVSRHFNRKISRQISRLLVKTSITPNQISVSMLFFSLLAGWLVASGDYVSLAIGGLLFQFASIVDGCDGEVAKLKFMGSHLGEWIDTVADSLSYMGFFGFVVYGMYRQSGDPFHLTLGAAILAVVALNLFVMYSYLRSTGAGSLAGYSNAFRDDVPKEKQGIIHRFLMKIRFGGRRDFFSAGFCVLAVLNLFTWMYWALMVGVVLLSMAIIGFTGYMLRTRGVWHQQAGSAPEAEKLVPEKAD